MDNRKLLKAEGRHIANTIKMNLDQNHHLPAYQFYNGYTMRGSGGIHKPGMVSFDHIHVGWIPAVHAGMVCCFYGYG